jgi:hypothetical protein
MSTPVETFVPRAMLKPTYTKEDPCSATNWSPEKSVFVWLKPAFEAHQTIDGRVVPGKSIESTIAMYEKWLASKPALKSAGVLRRGWARLFDKPCHHGVQTRLYECSTCDDQDRACIEYLQQLLPKVRAYYASREYWLSLNPYEFEAHVAAVFRRHGWKATVTKGSGDHGADVILERNDKIAIVQCKKYAKPVGPSTARELIGTLPYFRATHGILVCTGGLQLG